MKKALIAAALLLGANQAHAAPCAPGSLADYIGLGAGGCEIGSNALSDFTALPVSSGATEIAAATIGVVPIAGGPFGFGLDFLVNGTASGATVLEFLVGYRVQGAGISRARVHIDNASALEDGAVTAIKDICLDGLFTDFAFFGPGSCNGTLSTPLIAFQIAGDGLASDQQSFSPAGSISVVDDVVIDAGFLGTASLAVAGNRFIGATVAVPIPATAALLAFGMLCFGLTSIGNRQRSKA